MSDGTKVCDGCNKPSEFPCCEACYETRLLVFSHSGICNCSGCKIKRRVYEAQRARNC